MQVWECCSQKVFLILFLIFVVCFFNFKIGDINQFKMPSGDVIQGGRVLQFCKILYRKETRCLLISCFYIFSNNFINNCISFDDIFISKFVVNCLSGQNACCTNCTTLKIVYGFCFLQSFWWIRNNESLNYEKYWSAYFGKL